MFPTAEHQAICMIHILYSVPRLSLNDVTTTVALPGLCFLPLSLCFSANAKMGRQIRYCVTYMKRPYSHNKASVNINSVTTHHTVHIYFNTLKIKEYWFKYVAVQLHVCWGFRLIRLQQFVNMCTESLCTFVCPQNLIGIGAKTISG